jgi:endonuclease/exonuclease/phosphatase family metal-dependent hydrolase
MEHRFMRITKDLYILGIGILLLLTVQMATTLVESIYILDLLKTSLDEKALGVLFFFSPVLLLLLKHPVLRWQYWAAGALLILARSLTPYLGTVGRMLAAGVGTAAALVLFPLLLAAEIKASLGKSGTRPGLRFAQGLALAVGLSVLLRTLNYTIDLSLTPSFGWIGWVLGAVLGLVLVRWPDEGTEREQSKESTKGIAAAIPATPPAAPRGGAASAAVGLLAVLTLVYFVFSSPGVVARWTEGDYALIIGAVSLLSLGWLMASLLKPGWFAGVRSGVLAGWNLFFTLALVGTILAHTVDFPASPTASPVVVGSPVWYQQVPLLFMLVSFPVIFFDFAVFAGNISLARPEPRRLAPGFVLGSLLLVLLTFMNIFSNVWGYVEPVSPFFRGKFWLPFALSGGLLAILAWVHGRMAKDGMPGMIAGAPPVSERTGAEGVDSSNPPGKLAWGVSLGAVYLVTMLAALSTGKPDPAPPAKENLVVMTYNIQQANDEMGEKAFNRQLALIRQVDPDILGLQESDSARISLGNNDYVRYYAGRLGYHVYYGPKTVTGTFGTALLSKYPLENLRTVFTYSDTDEIGTAEAEVQVGDRRFALYNGHPAGSDEAMMVFATTLLGRAFRQANVIALGDYNLRESEEAYHVIADQYRDAWLAAFPTGVDNEGLDMSGDRRIDHVFVSPHLEVLDAVYLLPPDSATDHPVHWVQVGW